MVIRTLTAADFDAVHAAFVDAFSDYIVPLAPSREQFAEMLARRGYLPEASVGVWDGERLAAFTLNGVDGAKAYDTGTGVVRSHRRRGLARDVMLESFRALTERGCTSYVLEVLDRNQPAHALYTSLGFQESRGLQCWAYDAASDERQRQSGTAEPCDAEPSWQNSAASIARAREPRVRVGDETGYAIVFPSNGDLARIFVRPDARRSGLGTRLLREAAAVAGRPLRIINVDERATGLTRFLERAGAVRTVRQVEMIRALTR